MPFESPDPISGVTLPQHRVSIFTRGNEVIPGFRDIRKRKMDDGSRVSAAGKRRLSQIRHVSSRIPSAARFRSKRKYSLATDSSFPFRGPGEV